MVPLKKTEKKGGTLTMRQVAKLASVSQSAVSAVLNNRECTIKVSPETRQRVLQVIKDTGYHPNAIGRALSMKRTGYIGFILSDAIEGGWTNAYFARIFSGVELACRDRGYGLYPSIYNLSNLDSFIFPPKVSQCSVDGLILTGYVEAAVVTRFREFGVPCLCIGDNLEAANLIPTVADDTLNGVLQAVEYLVSLGHVRIGYCPGPTRRGRELANMIVAQAKTRQETTQSRIVVLDFGRWADYNLGSVLLKNWMDTPRAERPTAIIASDQSLAKLLKEMGRQGLSCPQHISLVSSGNTCICEYTSPSLTAVNSDLEGMGKMAVNMLVEHLEKKTLLDPSVSKNDFSFNLIIRESCSSPSE
jgi:DNA-binding LacI/PurR family transcriptional regulator